MDLAKIRKKSLQEVEAVPVPQSLSSLAVVPLFESSMMESFAEPRAPLEIIMAGRAAAQCGAGSATAIDVLPVANDESSHEFLCFRVSDEFYGIDIMAIKEIIKPRAVTEVPRAPGFVTGILSLRGVIIPILDMSIRLGLAHSGQSGKARVIVVKNKNSFSGLLVDEVIQVVRIKSASFEEAPAVMDGMSREFISAIGRSEDRMIIIVNVEKIADIDLN